MGRGKAALSRTIKVFTLDREIPRSFPTPWISKTSFFRSFAASEREVIWLEYLER
jgi:hypothetical protein